MLLEVFIDLICPWCYIGKRRLNRALAGRPRAMIDCRWRPFQLNPDMPPGGMEQTLYMAAKFGSMERARQIIIAVEEAAHREGLPMDLHAIRRTPNTLDGHRLVHFADAFGCAEAVLDTLYHAYFAEGLDISDRTILRMLGVRAGLDSRQIASHFAQDEDVETILASDLQARQMGLQAVPCFVFNRRFALSGAQETAAFQPLLDLTTDNFPTEISWSTDTNLPKCSLSNPDAPA